MASSQIKCMWLLILCFLQNEKAAIGETCNFKSCGCKSPGSEPDSIGNSKHRLGNAKRTAPDSHPWLAALYLKEDKMTVLAHGALYKAGSRLFVLTNGHSLRIKPDQPIFRPLSSIMVHLGAHNLHVKTGGWRQMHVRAAAVMAGFSVKSVVKNMAIIEISEVVELSSFIQPVCLPRPPATQVLKHDFPFKLTCFDAVNKVVVHDRMVVNEQEVCARHFPGYDPNSQICASFIESAVIFQQGDGGAPVVFPCGDEWILYGILTTVASKNYAAFNDVIAYAGWIDRMTVRLAQIPNDTVVEES